MIRAAFGYCDMDMTKENITKKEKISIMTNSTGDRRVYMGSGLPMTRKLDQIRPVKNIEYCRYNIHSDQATEFEIPGMFTMLRFMRHRVSEFAQKLGFTSDQVYDIVLAVGEAGTNAIKHGCSTPFCKVKIRMEKLADGMRVRVWDSGTGFSHESIQATEIDSMAENGRGILCMKAVMDKVYFHNQQTGVCVELVKYLPTAV